MVKSIILGKKITFGGSVVDLLGTVHFPIPNTLRRVPLGLRRALKSSRLIDSNRKTHYFGRGKMTFINETDKKKNFG